MNKDTDDMEPRNLFQGINSASLCSLTGRYDNPIPPRFLSPIDSSKIPALAIFTIERCSLHEPGKLDSLDCRRFRMLTSEPEFVNAYGAQKARMGSIPETALLNFQEPRNRFQEIDPPAYVARRPSTILFLLGS
jgi:hypothetical protein